MEEALRSIAGSFAQNRQAAPAFERALLVLLLALVLLQAALVIRRRRRRRAAFRARARRRGLAPGEVALLESLAGRVGEPPARLLSHLGLFERATAAALAAPAAPPDLARRLGALRRGLGFDRLPAHAPLLTTRELPPGVALEVDGRPGRALEVREDALAVEAEAEVAPWGAVALGLAHGGEARYLARCRVAAVAPLGPGRWRLALGHDEAPRRIQLREYARVAADGPLTLRPLEPAPGGARLPRELRAQLVDVSGGGALVTTAAPLPVGLLAGASFAVGRAAFGNVRAVVLASARRPDGRWCSHLEFAHLRPAERDRLVAAVEHREIEAGRAQAAGA